MSVLSDRIKAAQQAQQAGLLPGQKPQPEIASKENAEHAAAVATGMASSAQAIGTLPSAPNLNDEDYEQEKECLAVYRGERGLKMISIPGQGKLKAINTFFYPTNDAQIEQLDDFVRRGYARVIVAKKDAE